MIIRTKKTTPKVSKSTATAVKQREMRRKYPDEYKEERPSTELWISDNVKLVFQCKRQGDYGLPFIDIRQYVIATEPDGYTGFTKKGITIPCSKFDEFARNVNELLDFCDEKSFLDEEEEAEEE